MEMQTAFDDIRPYRDEEVPEIAARLAANPGFTEVMQFVFPERSGEDIRQHLSKIKTVDQFQAEIAHPAIRKLVDATSAGIEVSGLENIRPGETYLFISNHRDIILDSALLNVFLLENGHQTTETAIGNNLLSSELITDLTKLNKNFVVIRNTGARELYENSLRLSNYIRHQITGGHSGVWIAQREGRTKDGLDKTQPGLLKMLSIGCDTPLATCFKNLRVTPVAISYELDPCDVLKIPELKAVSRDEKYEKQPGEDFRSIITGLKGFKGRIHVSIGKTIDTEKAAESNTVNTNDKLREIGEAIDRQIFEIYKLWPTNLMAYDILTGEDAHASEYTAEARKKFTEAAKQRLTEAGLDAEEDYRWLLKMYANPVKNHMSVVSA